MSDQKQEFENLRPTTDVKLGIYESAIKYALEHDEVQNIAISGPYGSGKSSVIESYKAKDEEFNCIHISLSHFKSDHLSRNEYTDKETPNIDQGRKEKTINVNENVLEGKIINQLIHQTNPDNIPQTNFKTKKPASKKRIIINTLITAIFFLLLSHILLFNKWSIFVSDISSDWLHNVLEFSILLESLIISFLVCIGIVTKWIYDLITLQKTRSILKKINIRGTEIEVFEESKESYFDKYLNEVIYIFEHADANTIVFEDIDRYDVNQIFGKLREINTLVNNKRKQGSKLRFLYLIRDDIFTSTDRTKFFDFIIPIVPVIDSSNSYDQLTRLLSESAIKNKLSSKFLQELSLYIDDMRLLKNIVNEFHIYYDQISDIEIDCNKLLAIITYKNIFPKDFSDLQLNSGFVHTLFGSKLTFVEKEIKKLDTRINEIARKIEASKNEKLESVDELDTLFILDNIDVKSYRESIHSYFDSRLELIKAMKENEKDFIFVQRSRHSSGYSRVNISISEVLDQLADNQEYIERKEVIERKNRREIEKLSSNKQTLINEQIILQSDKLQDIITRENIDDIFSTTYTNLLGEKDSFKDIKGSPYFDLIKYLLRNGWIDEDYQSYMTHFYSDSLSLIDKNFLLSVTNQVPKEFTYELTSPETVLSKIELVDFDNEETLNFDLLDYLLSTKEKNLDHLVRLLKQIKTSRNITFINRFIDSGKEVEIFIKTFNTIWPDIFQYIIYEDEAEEDFIEKYAINSFYYSLEEDIEKLNENYVLSEWISDKDSFLDIENPNVDEIIAGLLLINVKFKWIDPKHADEQLFEAVYNNNLYELNIDVINLFLEEIYGYVHSLDFKHKNYTLIMGKPNESLAAYVREDINEYIETILNNCDEKITDNHEIVVQIINDDEIVIEIKEQYINYLETEIKFIGSMVEKELWEQLLNQKKIEYSVDNILHYYFKKELNETLINFINSQDIELTFNEKLIDDEYGEESFENFVYTIMNCNEIHLSRYEMIMNQANREYPNFSDKGIINEKVETLIELNIIPMNESILLFMREEYPDMLRSFVLHNIEVYVEDVINTDTFNHGEMLSLLNENVSEAYKLELLEYASDKILIEGEEYSDSVKLYILQHNFDDSELELLLLTYPNETSRIKKVLIDLFIEHVEEIIFNKYDLPFSLLKTMFESRRLNYEYKKDLLALSIPSWELDQVKECLSILEMDDFLSLFYQKRPRFAVNETNRKLLTIFEERHWITKFYKDEKHPDDYRAIGRDLQSALVGK